MAVTSAGNNFPKAALFNTALGLGYKSFTNLDRLEYHNLRTNRLLHCFSDPLH